MTYEKPLGTLGESGKSSNGESPLDDAFDDAPASLAETGLIVPVPELEAFIGEWRRKVDAVPPEGVPAHISLLYPYLEPTVCAWTKPDVAEFFAEIEPFDFELTDVGWFDRRVVFLKPDPAERFLGITESLMSRWTQCQPYGGKHSEVVPHLTLGIDGSDDEMQALAAAAREILPVRCRATEVWLMEGTPHPPAWRISATYPLGH